MWREASAPNPVETPYDGVSEDASAATASREDRIAVIAASVSATPAPRRATAMTSSSRSPLVSRTT